MYSICFRKKVLAIREQEKLSIKQTAIRFAISIRTIVNWLQRLEPITKRNKAATKIDMDSLTEDVKQYPDAYLYERASRLNVSRSCIHRALKRLTRILHTKSPKCVQVQAYQLVQGFY
jgi:transposase